MRWSDPRRAAQWVPWGWRTVGILAGLLLAFVGFVRACGG